MFTSTRSPLVAPPTPTRVARTRAVLRAVAYGVVLCAGLSVSGTASAFVVCQGAGWSATGEAPWKPSTKQVKDIISQARDRPIPGNFSCCNKERADGRICQDYKEDANGNVTEVGDEHGKKPPTRRSPG